MLTMTSAHADEGARLFTGERALVARLAADVTALPVTATRCVNCHRDAKFGASIDRAALIEPRARRGGPPSTYDRASFCRVLRSGIDAADVVIARTMPRYEIPDADCAALWSYLIAQ